MSNRLKDKVALVTAAGQGIGKATAIAFHNEGAKVIATDINDKTLAELNKEYPKIEVKNLDSTNYDTIKKYVSEIDKIDILFNAVGFVHHGTILECDEKDWDFSSNVNVKSMYFMCKAILPLMVKQKEGSIINVSSCASSLKGFPNRFVYGTTKGAVIGLTKSIAADFVKQNIRCNSIAPGTVFSPSWQDRVNQSPDPVQAKKDFRRIMKLLRVGQKGNEKPAALDKGGKIRDISSLVKDLNPEYLNFNTLSKLQNIDLSSLSELSSSERVGSCIVKPGKFIGIGLNFSDHAAESGLPVPSEPIMFMKATSCISGPNDNIEMVANSKKLDWEVELGIIIGKAAKHIEQSQSQDHILGYCLVNDVSEREWQIEKMGQWVKGKSHDTYGPIGPYLVTKDDIKDVNNLNMSLDLNGKRMQTGNTNTMIFNVDVIVSYVSKFMSLHPGDIITTGTPPGVGMGMKPQLFLKSGDKMKLSIDNLGEQNSKVVSL